ncbi:hypothetical protein BLNAU_14602 [Blattamonas nauphoetae]|uniref:Uncharacterized protein n=1 Tax=Blattamonas nauphoetae TaxID=2049346 RepID=A0ABQ9XI26_9EUKA|nr:hypothetical protein BLNAU_14602 [Blattamonas nauphoetae]
MLASCLGSPDDLILQVVQLRSVRNACSVDRSTDLLINDTMVYHSVFPFVEIVSNEQSPSLRHSNELFVPSDEFLSTACMTVQSVTDHRQHFAPESMRQHVFKWTTSQSQKQSRSEHTSKSESSEHNGVPFGEQRRSKVVELKKNVIQPEEKGRTLQKHSQHLKHQKSSLAMSTLGFSPQHRLSSAFWKNVNTLASEKADKPPSLAHQYPPELKIKDKEKTDIGEKDLKIVSNVVTVMFNLLNTIGPFLIPETILLVHTVCLLAHSSPDTHGLVSSLLSRFIATFSTYYIFSTPALLLFVACTCQPFATKTELAKDNSYFGYTSHNPSPLSKTKTLSYRGTHHVQLSVFQELLEVGAMIGEEAINQGIIRSREDQFLSQLFAHFLTSKFSRSRTTTPTLHNRKETVSVQVNRKKRPINQQHSSPSPSATSIAAQPASTANTPTSLSLFPLNSPVQVSTTLSRVASRVSIPRIDHTSSFLIPELSLEPLEALIDTPHDFLLSTLRLVKPFLQSDPIQLQTALGQVVSVLAVIVPFLLVRSLLMITKVAQQQNKLERELQLPVSTPPSSEQLSPSDTSGMTQKRLQYLEMTNQDYNLATPTELAGIWEAIPFYLSSTPTLFGKRTPSFASLTKDSMISSSFIASSQNNDLPTVVLNGQTSFTIRFSRITSRFYARLAYSILHSSTKMIQRSLDLLATKGEFELGQHTHNSESQTTAPTIYFNTISNRTTLKPREDHLSVNAPAQSTFPRRPIGSPTFGSVRRLGSKVGSTIRKSEKYPLLATDTPRFISDYAAITLVSIIRIGVRVQEYDNHPAALEEAISDLWMIPQKDDFITQPDDTPTSLTSSTVQLVPVPQGSDSSLHPRLLFFATAMLRVAHYHQTQLGPYVYNFVPLFIKIGIASLSSYTFLSKQNDSVLSTKRKLSFETSTIQSLLTRFFSDSVSIPNSNFGDFLKKLLPIATAPIHTMFQVLKPTQFWPPVNMHSETVSFSLSQSIPHHSHTNSITSPFSVDSHIHTPRQYAFPVLRPSIFSPIFTKPHRRTPTKYTSHNYRTCPFCLGRKLNKQFCPFAVPPSNQPTSAAFQSSTQKYTAWSPRSNAFNSLLPILPQFQSPISPARHTRSLSFGAKSEMSFDLISQVPPSMDQASIINVSEHDATPKLMRSASTDSLSPLNFSRSKKNSPLFAELGDAPDSLSFKTQRPKTGLSSFSYTATPNEIYAGEAFSTPLNQDRFDANGNLLQTPQNTLNLRLNQQTTVKKVIFVSPELSSLVKPSTVKMLRRDAEKAHESSRLKRRASNVPAGQHDSDHHSDSSEPQRLPDPLHSPESSQGSPTERRRQKKKTKGNENVLEAFFINEFQDDSNKSSDSSTPSEPEESIEQRMNDEIMSVSTHPGSPSYSSLDDSDAEQNGKQERFFEVESFATSEESSSFSDNVTLNSPSKRDGVRIAIPSNDDQTMETEENFGLVDSVKNPPETQTKKRREKNSMKQLGTRIELYPDENFIFHPNNVNHDTIFTLTTVEHPLTFSFFLPSFTSLFLDQRQPISIDSFNHSLFAMNQLLDVCVRNIFRFPLFQNDVLSLVHRMFTSLSPFIRIFGVEVVGTLIHRLMFFLTTNTTRLSQLLEDQAGVALVESLHSSLLALFSTLRLIIRCNPYTDAKQTALILLHHFVEVWLSSGFSSSAIVQMEPADTQDTPINLTHSCSANYAELLRTLRERILTVIILSAGDLLASVDFPDDLIEPRYEWFVDPSKKTEENTESWGMFLFRATQEAFPLVQDGLDQLVATVKMSQGQTHIQTDSASEIEETMEQKYQPVKPSPYVPADKVIRSGLSILQLVAANHLHLLSASNTALVQKVLIRFLFLQNDPAKPTRDIPSLSTALAAVGLFNHVHEYAQKMSRLEVVSSLFGVEAAEYSDELSLSPQSIAHFAQSFTFARMLSLHLLSQLILSPSIELRTSALGTLSIILSSIRIDSLSSLQFFFALLDKLIRVIHSLWFELLNLSKDTAWSMIQPNDIPRTPTLGSLSQPQTPTPKSPQLKPNDDHKHIEFTITEIVKMIADVMHSQLPSLIVQSGLMEDAFVVGTEPAEGFSLTLTVCALILNLLLFGTTELSDAALHFSHVLLYKTAEILRALSKYTQPDVSAKTAQNKIRCASSFFSTLWKTFQLFIEVSVAGCHHRNTSLTTPSELHAQLNGIANSIDDLRMPFTTSIGPQQDETQKLAKFIQCPLCSLFPSKAASLLILISPLIPRAAPKPSIDLKHDQLCFVQDNNTFLSHNFQFKSSVLGSAALDADPSYFSSLITDTQIKPSQLSPTDISEIDSSATQLSMDTLSSLGLDISTEKAESMSESSVPPKSESLFAFHPLFTPFIHSMEHLLSHRYFHIQKPIVPALSLTLFGPLTTFSAVSSNASRIARIARTQNTNFVRTLFPTLNNNVFELNTHMYNTQALGINMDVAPDSTDDNSTSDDEEEFARLHTLRVTKDWHIDSGLYAISPADPQQHFACCTADSNAATQCEDSIRSLSFNTDLPTLIRSEDISRCLLILTVLFTTHSPFLVPFSSPASAVFVDSVTGHVGHRFVSPPSGPYLDSLMMPSTQAVDDEWYRSAPNQLAPDDINLDGTFASTAEPRTEIVKRYAVRLSPITVPPRTKQSDRLEMCMSWPYFVHPTLIGIHNFPPAPVSRSQPDAPELKTLISTPAKRIKLQLPFVHNQVLHSIAFLIPFLAHHHQDGEQSTVLLRHTVQSVWHLLHFSLLTLKQINDYLVFLHLPKADKSEETGPSSQQSQQFLKLQTQNRIQLFVSYLTAAKLVSAALQQCVLLIRPLLERKMIHSFLTLLLSLVRPLLHLSAFCPPLRHTVSSTFICFFSSILHPQSTFFASLPFELVTVLFHLLSIVVQTLTPSQHETGVDVFSHLELGISWEDDPAASLDTYLELLQKSIEEMSEGESFSLPPLPEIVFVDYVNFVEQFSQDPIAIEDTTSLADAEHTSVVIRAGCHVLLNKFNEQSTALAITGLTPSLFSQQLNTILTQLNTSFRVHLTSGQLPRSTSRSPHLTSHFTGTLSPTMHIHTDDLPLDIHSIILQRKNDAMNQLSVFDSSTTKKKDTQTFSISSKPAFTIVNSLVNQPTSSTQSGSESQQKQPEHPSKPIISGSLAMLTCSPMHTTAQQAAHDTDNSLSQRCLEGPLFFSSPTQTFTCIRWDEENTTEMWMNALARCFIPSASEFHLRMCECRVQLDDNTNTPPFQNTANTNLAKDGSLLLSVLQYHQDARFILNFALVSSILSGKLSPFRSLSNPFPSFLSVSPLLSLVRHILSKSFLSTSAIVPRRSLSSISSLLSLIRNTNLIPLKVSVSFSSDPNKPSAHAVIVSDSDLLSLLVVTPLLTNTSSFISAPPKPSLLISSQFSSQPSEVSANLLFSQSTFAFSFLSHVLSLPQNPFSAHFLANLNRFHSQTAFYTSQRTNEFVPESSL